MKREYAKSKRFTLFSTDLLHGIEKRLKQGEQILLFLNRRGYHTYQICTHCGNHLTCPHCAKSLTFYKYTDHLICHLCSYQLTSPPKRCPTCNKEGPLHFKGVGTEQVEKRLHALFPTIRTLRMDGDTTRHKGSHDLFFQQFKSGKADLLIGTQMITKGLHFPGVTLVGVLKCDGALNLPDFRASEHTFQLLTQVAGRSGRDSLAGEVIIQTFMHEHPIFHHASHEDYRSFYREEIKSRQFFHFPPFTRLAKLTFSGKDDQQVQHYAQNFHAILRTKLPSSYTLYPVVPAGYPKIQDRFRFKIIVKGNRPFLFSSIMQQIQQTTPVPPSIHLLIDIDPLSTFA